MGCLYCNFGGTCQFYDEDEYGIVKHIHDTDYGFVGKGICVVDDDPDPSYTCEAYESNDPTEDEETEDEELVAFHEHIDKLQKEK